MHDHTYADSNSNSQSDYLRHLYHRLQHRLRHWMSFWMGCDGNQLSLLYMRPENAAVFIHGSNPDDYF
ncbi:hypothetical protein EST38_g5660 [Candolleomyces aberdarensis]|uniref:Uncharacterized protein n=1 Tax=Candolleomyces aberdarensis TaxID=2316362 RepID=A0A4Q2DJJ0_9AGAR|nr:hypothetical protein EST38_g5660 [Candolleomyces aberdarensis]